MCCYFLSLLFNMLSPLATIGKCPRNHQILHCLLSFESTNICHQSILDLWTVVHMLEYWL